MKNRFFPLLHVLAVLVGLTACSGQEVEAKYILTEFETVVPDGSVQKTVHHYNEDWVLTGSTVYRDGEINMEIVYELNEHGDLASITCTTADLTQTEEHVCSYDDRGNLIRTEIYMNGEQTASTTTEYVFDPDNVLISMVQHSGQAVYEHFYNPDGTVAKMVYTVADWDVQQTTLYTYDENGSEIRSETYNQAGTLIMETNSSYDKAGRIQVSVDTRYNEDGTPAESTAAEYTWDGLIRTTHSIGQDGTETIRAITEYDAFGNILRHEIYNGQQLMSRQVMTYQAVEIPVE